MRKTTAVQKKMLNMIYDDTIYLATYVGLYQHIA